MSWPLIRQLLGRRDGTGDEAMSDRTRSLSARTSGANVTRSVCPYCAVGCGQLVYHRNGRILSIEGDPESPINQGTLCPKGSASRELLTHPARLMRVLYRAPRTRHWQPMALQQAVDLVADRIWESRKRTFIREREGHFYNHTSAVAHLGGATLDNEENYLIKKLFTAGLGMVSVSNQARI
jgi:formate dehydrogenase major subunit